MRPDTPPSPRRPAASARAWLLAALLLGAFSLASAHAALDTSDPAADAVVDTPPSQVTLTFSEPLEVAFSLFGVHRLDAQLDMDEEDAAQRLNGLAAPRVKAWLDSPDEDGSLVPLTVEPASGASAEVTLVFEEALAPGHYVVVWRVLSADTHPVEDFFTFTVLD